MSTSNNEQAEEWLKTQIKIEEHEKKVHRWKTKSKEEIKDTSCLICYPIQGRPRRDFWNFWRWYRKKTGAQYYKKIKTIMEIIESIRYSEKGIEIPIAELILSFKEMWWKTDKFQEDTIGRDEELSEYSSEAEKESVRSIISRTSENLDSVQESEEFRKFWEIMKRKIGTLKSFKKEAVEAFEKLMKINVTRGME